MSKFVFFCLSIIICVALNAQSKDEQPILYLDAGVSYNIIDGYHYNLIGDLTSIPKEIFPLRVNLGVRGDLMLDHQNRIGARIRLAFLNYGYKSTDYYIIEIPAEITWTFYQDLPIYIFAGYCIPILDGIGGPNFGIHAEYKGFFIEVASKIYNNSSNFGLNAMFGYSFHFINGVLTFK